MSIVQLQNLVTCNNVAPVAGGTPHYDTNGCISGYYVGSGNNNSSNSGSIDDIAGRSQQSAWSSNQHTGVYYSTGGQTYDVTFDSQERAYYKDQYGNKRQVPQQDSTYSNVYFDTSNGQRQKASVDSYGRLSFWGQNGQMTDLRVDTQGKPYYSQNGSMVYLGQMNNNMSQGMNNMNQGGRRDGNMDQGGIRGHGDGMQEAGSMYYTDQSGMSHILLIDQQGGYYKDNSGEHSVSSLGRAYYMDSQGNRKTLDITNAGKVFIMENGLHTQVDMNQQGKGYYHDDMNRQVVLGQANQNNFNQNNGMMTGNNNNNMFNNGMEKTGYLYYIDEQGQKYQMFVDQQGGFYKNSRGQDQAISNRGQAYYVNYNGQKKQLNINQNSHVMIRLNGQEYTVGENAQGEGYFYNRGQQYYLGDRTMSQFLEIDFIQGGNMQGGNNQQHFDQGRGLVNNNNNQGGFNNQSVNTQAGSLVYYDQNNNSHALKIDNQGAYYTDNQGKDHSVFNQAYYYNSQGQRKALQISGNNVSYIDNSGVSHSLKTNNQGQAYYYGQQGMVMLAQELQNSNVAQPGASAHLDQGRSLANGLVGGGAMGPPAGAPGVPGSNMMPTTGVPGGPNNNMMPPSGQQQQPQQKAGCPSVAPVAGGKPYYGSDGCIQSYVVSLQMLI